MKKNTHKYIFNRFKIVLAVAIFSLLSGNLFAQSFNVDAVTSSDPTEPSPYYVINDTIINGAINTVGGFAEGDNFYFYYNNTWEASGNLYEDQIIDQAAMSAIPWTENVFSGTIGETGLFNLYVGQFNGRFDYESNLTEDDVAVYYGSTTPIGNWYNQAGNRTLTTNSFDLAGETDEVALNLSIDVNNLNSTYPLVVEYSIDASTWVLMEDDAGADSLYNELGHVFSGNYILPAQAKVAAVSFRVRQLNSVSLPQSTTDFALWNISIRKGSVISEVFSQYIGQFEIVDPIVVVDPIPSINTMRVCEIDAIDAADPTLASYYAGEEVALVVETSNIEDFADYSYFIDLQGYELTSFDTVTGADSIVFSITIPTDISEFYGSTPAFTLKIVDGTEIIEPIGISEDLVSGSSFDEDNLNGGFVYNTNYIEFSGAGLRQYTSNPFNIASIDFGIDLDIAIRRLGDAVPPAGTELYLQYTTNGSTWTGIDTIYFSGVDGVTTNFSWFSYDEEELAGVVSANTQFRIIQLSEDNLIDINAWEIRDFYIDIPAAPDNIVAEGSNESVNPWTAVSVSTPSFVIALDNADNDVIFPGSTVNFVTSNVLGVYPDGTYYEVIIDGMVLETLTTLDDFSIVAPFNTGYKTINVEVIADESVVFTTTDIHFTIQPVSVEITDISTDYSDSDGDYNIPNKNIAVDFALSGQILNNTTTLELQLRDQLTLEWQGIASIPVTAAINTAQGGTIVGVLPRIDYGGATVNNADVKVVLIAEDCECFTESYSSIGVNYFIQDDAYYMNGLTWPANATKAVFDIYSNGGVSGTIEYKYYNGSRMPTFASKDISYIDPSFVGDVNSLDSVSDYVAIDDFARVLDLLAVRNPGFNSGDLEFRGVTFLIPVAPLEVESSTQTIQVMYPSVSFATVNSALIYGETLSMQYNTFGINAGVANFAITLEQNNNVYILEDTVGLGLVTMDVAIPTEEVLTANGFNLGNQYEIRVRAYDIAFDSPEIADLDETLDADDYQEFTGLSGYNGPGDGSSYYTYFWFRNNESRYAITKPYDLTVYNEPITLEFDYRGYITDYISESTLPKLQVSTDGGATYENISVEASEYSDISCLDASGYHSYSVEIDPMYFTEATYFRWKQDVVTAVAHNDWRLYSYRITGVNNLVSDIVNSDISYVFINNEGDIAADYDNINGYTLSFNGYDNNIKPAIKLGEDNAMTWAYDSGTEWPDSTMYEFIIPFYNEEIDANDTIFLSSIDTSANIVLNIPIETAITTGYYPIKVRANLEYINSEGETVQHIRSYGGNTDYVEANFNNMTVLIVNETNPEFEGLVLSDVTAVNDEENTDLTPGNFYYGEKLFVNYSIVGAYDDDVRFETVLSGYDNNGDEMFVNLGNIGSYLDLSNAGSLSEVIDTVSIPSYYELDMAGFNLNNTMKVGVAAYSPENATADFKSSYIDLNINTDYLKVDNGSGGTSLYFSGTNNKRYAVTNALASFVDASSPVTNHTLSFTYDEVNTISPLTNQTVPRLQVSIDAGVTYVDVKAFLEDADVSIVLEQEWLDNAYTTHFRWIQEYPTGTWQIYNVQVVESNLFNQAYSDETTITINDVPSNYPDNFTNYELSIAGGADENGIEEPIMVSTDTDLTWTLVDVSDEANTWAMGTAFEFTIEDMNGDIVVLDTVTNLGSFSINLSTDLFETGAYEISVRAYVPGDEEYLYPVDGNSASVFKDVLVINEVEEDVIKLIAEDLETLDYEIGETLTMYYEQYGVWDADTKFAIALEQVDFWGDVQDEQILELVTELLGDSISVKMPDYLSQINNYNYLQATLYAYKGDNLLLGNAEVVSYSELYGGNDYGSYIRFYSNDQRYLVTEEYDLSNYKEASLSFEYYGVDPMPENTMYLPRLEVSIDGGDTFVPLAIDNDEAPFGADGYLPYSTGGYLSFDVSVPAEYATEATLFRFMQLANNGSYQEEWRLRNINVVDGRNVVENYLTDNVSQTIIFNVPTENDYVYSLVRDADGYEPVLYRGSTNSFTYAMDTLPNGDLVGTEFAAGTTFDFYLMDYPANGDSLFLAAGTGTTHSFTLPSDIERASYDINARISNADGVIVKLVDNYIGTMTIFNPEIQTVIENGEEILYAGNSTNFSATVNSIGTLDPTWYYNLTVDDGSDTWLLASQLGSVDFADVALPTYLNGTTDFEIVATLDNAMAEVGDQVNLLADYVLFNGTFNTNASQGEVYNYTRTDLDLSDKQLVKFDIYVSNLDVTENQKMALEYSIDGGNTYVELAKYPDARFTEDALVNGWFSEEVVLPAEAKVEEAVLRWKIDEYASSYSLRDIALEFEAADYVLAPISSISASETVRIQRIDVTELVYTQACGGGSIELFYSIKGKFGADNVVTPDISVWPYALTIDNENIEYLGIIEGEGSIVIDLSTLDNKPNGDAKFLLNAFDETVSELRDDNSYDVYAYGAWSQYAVEIDPIDAVNTVFIYDDGNVCGAVERIASIRYVQENFKYQLRNYLTGENIGDAVVIDDENDDLMDDETYPYWDGGEYLKLDLGILTEELTVEVLVTAQNADASIICDSVIPTDKATFTIAPEYAVYYMQGSVNIQTKVTEGQVFEFCEGTTDLEFYHGYYLEGVFQNVTATWVRDSLDVESTSYYYIPSYVSGSYQAIYNNGGDCEAGSVGFSVNVLEKPELPEITAQGELNACEGDIVTLTATEGFTYYRWTRNNSIMNVYTQAIEVEETGTYRVQVSNVPFAQDCFSAVSNPVEITIFEFNNIAFSTPQIELCRDEATAKVTINASQTDVTYFLKDESTDVTFATVVGTGSAITFTTDAITAEMQQFYLEAVWDLKTDCSKLVNTNTLTISSVPDYSIIVRDEVTYRYELSEAGVEYCEGARLAVGTIDDLTGNTVSNVTWYKDGYSIAGSTISNAEAGVYKVKYLPQTGDCEYFTAEITVNKVERPTIVNEGNLEFCEGQEELILTATSGHAAYEWYTYNSGPISNVESTDNALHVTTTGQYRVIAVSEDGCRSESSLYVDVTIHNKPNVPSNFTIVEDVLCEPGYVNVVVNYAESNVTYHLIDVVTGEALSTPVIGNSNLVLSTTDFIEENVTMAIAANRADVNACSVTSLPFDIEVYNLTIEIYGNVLFANIPDAVVSSYRWFRNGVAVTNGGNKSELTIYDDAAYSVIVITNNGCTLELATKEIVEPENTKSATIAIYPNPVNNDMNLSLTNLTGNVDVRIIDISGKVCGVFNYTIEEDEVMKTLDLNDLTKGFFTIEIKGENSKQIKHFIKN